MLCWNTVDNTLKEILAQLMQVEIFKAFRLVGGTALSLHWGHRMSIDIDLFTDEPYGSIDFNKIDAYLKDTFTYLDAGLSGNPGMGKSYFVGVDKENAIKLDVYYTTDPFFQEPIEEDGIRMATAEEIIAMKVDVVQRGGRKKDFWDLHEALGQYSIRDMIALHKQRFKWTHDEITIRRNFTDFTTADDDFDPICLRGKQWVFVKEDMEDAMMRL